MNAKEARVITDKAKEHPEYMHGIFRNIHHVSSIGHSEIHFQELSKNQKEWLKQNGYSLTEEMYVFGAGNPPTEAIKIKW